MGIPWLYKKIAGVKSHPEHRQIGVVRVRERTKGGSRTNKKSQLRRILFGTNFTGEFSL